MRILFVLLFMCCSSAIAQEISGRVEGGLSVSSSEPNFLSQGSGILRSEGSEILLQQGFIRLEHDWADAWHIDMVGNIYSDGERKLGLTQAFIRYKPLMQQTVKFQSRVGFFYPELSIENTQPGWLSPYTYTQSAINSWFGEELRTLGAEFSLLSNGRARRSPWSWETHLGVYKGNDPIGSLLTWRGFALHDRQSLHHDKIPFSPIPTVISEDLVNGPNYVEPFTEIDGKWGFYLGLQARYFRKTEVRYYYYDNLADPTAVNQQRLYAWRTKFHSLTFQHQLSPQWRVMAQVLDGATDMGSRFVYADFSSAYVAVSWNDSDHRISARLDLWDVDEDDRWPQDQNNSHGIGVTVAWRYAINSHWELGSEYHWNKNRAANRRQFSQSETITQQQLRLVLSYQF